MNHFGHKFEVGNIFICLCINYLTNIIKLLFFKNWNFLLINLGLLHVDKSHKPIIFLCVATMLQASDLIRHYKL